jgi:CRP-like cAMP-binding protein
MEGQHPMTQFKKEEFVYFPEDASNYIYMIAEGRVKIGSYLENGKESVKAILSKGEIFGELALAGEYKRLDFAQALDSETIVCPMTLKDMQELMANNQPLSFKMMKLIGLRLRKAERRLESLVFKDARTRIVEFLKDEADERGKKIGYETMIPSHLTHKDIAALTGTSRQTVTTTLNELREKNIINFDRRKILIRDMELLA